MISICFVLPLIIPNQALLFFSFFLREIHLANSTPNFRFKIIFSKIVRTRGVQDHLCRGEAQFFVPLKNPFLKKNIDTFFNYVHSVQVHY